MFEITLDGLENMVTHLMSKNWDAWYLKLDFGHANYFKDLQSHIETAQQPCMFNWFKPGFLEKIAKIG